MSAVAWVGGPAWSPPGLNVFSGRFPLSVEAHALRMVALLVPGATTVTPHSRYYAIHALIATEVEGQGLDEDDAFELLRRCEVVVAGASAVHDHAGFGRAHGMDVIAPRLRSDGHLRVGELQVPSKTGYVQARRGFWDPYVGSELALQILDSGRVPTPGPRCNGSAVREGLDGLVDLARQNVLSVEELESADHLCICAGGERRDGAWLRQLLCAPPTAEPGAPVAKIDRARGETIRLLGRVVDHLGAVDDVTRGFQLTVAFGSFLDADPVASGLDVAPAWRGLLLRHYTVGAWRRLWAWLVDQVEELIRPDQLASAFADELPDISVSRFVDTLPPTEVDGAPVPAEELVRESAGTLPATELGVLALGALRSRELVGTAHEAFVGRDVELGPAWMLRRLESSAEQRLRDFGIRLVHDVILRARRISMFKMRRGPDGRIDLPTRLYERGGHLYRTSREGGGDVGLRLAQLTTVLAGVGVFRWGESGWELTEAGHAALI